MLSNKIINDDEAIVLLQRNNELLSAILKAQLSDILEKELSDKKLEKLYALTGQKTIKEIAKILSMGDKTITSIWKRWEMFGILIKDNKGYRKMI